MKGEIPQIYSDLLTRFKCNYPRVMNIKDIHNILLLTDHHLSFLEEHVASIMYLYRYPDEKEVAYELGRVIPRSPIDISFLTLQLPHVQSHLSTQVLVNLSSTRNLNQLFASMDQEQHEDDLRRRYDQMNRNINCYIEDKYKDYLSRTNQRPCKDGRIVSFTMVELGEMPKASLPLPLTFVVLTPDDVLKDFQRDVDKAVDENRLVPSAVQFKQRNEHGFDFDLDDV
ncbi:hypothetical protein JH06_3154 [Blastocystis sp. subtype 4]|uniref:hypothetical protein n=1 Tax=Blastocystis sp. subtype 4 TaxID=944170 RepID=UPI000711FE89|nr:hypothetical protein JH06_3154 [Blastocystis sp. subtype 4]KNB43342.1 hypothetical protein JH06_3154 [Blastocystis sp. subtype 4]|eukprot:XP_014526785.1 hypothetical protein JH06_3154 [Blastocystis sp. subtype 4]